MTKTERIITKMMKECTGVHFLDSGGYEDRNWQINQKVKSFKQQPEGILKWYEFGPEIQINTFHFLVDKLVFDLSAEKFDKMFNNFVNKKGNKDVNYLETMEQFPVYLQELGYDIQEGWGTCNSYNCKSLLSQTIQFVHMNINRENYIVLQIHNGYDVRGGYTKPRVFTEYEEDGIFDFNKATVYCNNCHAIWYIEDACNIKPNEDSYKIDFKDLIVEEIEDINQVKIKNNKLYVNKNTATAYCPVCNIGFLKVSLH